MQADPGRMVRPGTGGAMTDADELGDAVECDHRRDGLGGSGGQLGVEGVDGGLLDLMARHGTTCHRDAGVAPPGPAADRGTCGSQGSDQFLGGRG